MAKTKNYEDREDGLIAAVVPVEGAVAKGYVPEGFDSVKDFLSDMREQYVADLKFDQDNREAALEDKKFSAGEQWDPLVLEQRKGLPNLILNPIPQFTAQLVGDWRESRKAIKVIPSNDEDVEIASIRGDLIRAIETQSRASRVYDSAFESVVQCGDGSFRVTVEHAKTSVWDQDIFIRPIEDCLSVVWDRFSVDPTGRDARRVFVNDRIPIKEYEAKWKDSLPPDDLFSSDMMSDLTANQWLDNESYRVTEYWRLIERRRLMALFENGKTFIIDDTNQDQILEENGPPIRMKETWVTYAQMHLVSGFAILSGPYEYLLNRLPIIRMSGRYVNVGGRRVRYGLVRFIKDVIRNRNFQRSIAMEGLGYAPKAKWLATESAVEGREDQFRRAHLTRDPLLVYNDDADPPQLIPPAPIEAALLTEADRNTQDMKDITGIHDASLGIRSNETSGRAIMARQREGDIASLTFYDNAEAAVLEAGDVINQLIPQIYDGTRTIRIIGEDEAVKFAKINDPMDPKAIDLSVGEYDVMLGTGVSYSTRRQEASQAMMDMVQVFPQLAQFGGDIIAKNMDFPGADDLAKRWKKTIPGNFLDEDDPDRQEAGMPTPEELQMLQQQLQQLMMENQELKTDRSLDKEKLEIDSYNAKTQRIRALSDHWVDEQGLQQTAIKNILDGAREVDAQDIREIEMQMRSDDMTARREQARQASSSAGGSSPSNPGNKTSTGQGTR